MRCGCIGICGLYERKLRELNPAIRNISYDIGDLYNFIDGLADMSALVYVSLSLSNFIDSGLENLMCLNLCYIFGCHT